MLPGNSVLSVPSPQLSLLRRVRGQHKGVLVAELPPAVGTLVVCPDDYGTETPNVWTGPERTKPKR